MNIKEVYKKYKTPPQLQLHQLRVAAVEKQIFENSKIMPENITDKSIAPIIEILKNYDE